MWVILEVLRGGREGHRQEFKDKSTITVGRNVHCDLVLDPHSDNLASGVHGEVRRASDGSHWWIDRGSSNGSFIGGERVQQAPLQEGSQVELGPKGPVIAFRFIGDPAVAQKGPAVQSSAQAVPPASAENQAQAAPQAPVPGGHLGDVQPQPPPPTAPTPAPQAQSQSAPAASPASAPTSGAEDKKVGRATVARIVEQALVKERQGSSPRSPRTPRSTRFLRSFVDSEVRKKNRGLFISTLVLGVLLLGAMVTAAVFFLRQRSEQKEKEEEHKKALARATRDSQDREKKLKGAIQKLRSENEKIRLMARDKGPRIAEKNKEALYLLAHGTSGFPRYAVCTAFAVSKRLLATNAHCVKIVEKLSKRGSYFYVIKNEDPVFKARVVAYRHHPKYKRTGVSISPDLGLLKVRKDLPKLVELASTEDLKKVKQGSILFSFGFPGRLADPKKPVATLVHGHVGRLTRFDNALGTFEENQLLQHSALSMGGASGSPLFNADGKVIGIHAGSYAAQATETIFGSGGKRAKVRVAKRLGYKYGIRADLLRAFMATKGWTPVKVSGVLALVSTIPQALKAVNCKVFHKKLTVCSARASFAMNMKKRCEISQKVPAPTSIAFLRMVKCMLAVKGCNKSALKKCVHHLKKSK